jgi:glycerophosphoryl diester phosphodiesterase
MTKATDWESNAPLVIAHRGASAYAPENTIAAFNRAVAIGADAIELDARLTRDGVIVVMHDDTIDRTTDGTGLLRRCSYDELQILDAGSSFSSSFKGERVPTLEQVLQEMGGSVLINVELANSSSPWNSLPDRVIRLVEKLNLIDRVLISSFNPIALRRTRSLNDEIKIGLLIHGRVPALVRSTLKFLVPHEYIHPHESLIRNVRARWDRKINVWTVNDENRMRELLTSGIAGIITDVPDVAIRVRSEVLGEL